jgi:hypothetical protein
MVLNIISDVPPDDDTFRVEIVGVIKEDLVFRWFTCHSTSARAGVYTYKYFSYRSVRI